MIDKATLIEDIRSWGRGAGTIAALEQVLAEEARTQAQKRSEDKAKIEDLTKQLQEAADLAAERDTARLAAQNDAATLRAENEDLKKQVAALKPLVPVPQTGAIVTNHPGET